MIQIELNGEPKTLAAPLPLPEFLRDLGLGTGLLIEHNGRALFPSEWAETQLADGDRLEILRVSAGG